MPEAMDLGAEFAAGSANDASARRFPGLELFNWHACEREDAHTEPAR
jgi:hypothetical protein